MSTTENEPTGNGTLHQDAGQPFDANAYREASLRGWEEAASGWVRSQRLIRDFAEPVSRWMIDAVAPQPGQRVLELAAGVGETGLLAAGLVAPDGAVIVSDQAEAMLAGARERATQLGLTNVELKAINAESIDLPVACVDAVLCRWGYMLMADPAAALGETRRVLKPGGRVAFAVWDDLAENPWASIPGAVLRERGLLASVPPGTPGPFMLYDRRRLRELLEDAGFADVRIEALDLHRLHRDFDDFWETTLDLSRSFHDAVLERPPAEALKIRDEVRARLARAGTSGRRIEAPDGSLDVPARTLVVAASA